MAPPRGDRHLRQRNTLLECAFGCHQLAIVDEHDALAMGAVRGQQRMLAVDGEESDGAAAFLGHAGDDRVGSVQHRHAVGGDVLHDHALEHGQVLDRGDEVQSKVVAAADVGNHRHLAAVEGQAFAQYAAARGLEHGGIDVRMQQHVARAPGTAAVAAVDLAPFDVHAVGVGHADAQPGLGEDVRDQPHGGGLAVGAGDGHHGNAAIVAFGKHLADDCLAHRAALAVGRRQVHAQSGRGIDLDDAAVLVLDGFVHGVAHDVDAADVQSHHLRRRHGASGDVRVHVVGDVGGGAAGGQIGVVAQQHALAERRHAAGIHALFGQARQRDVIEADAGQRSCMATAAARIGVDNVDQLAHRVRAVADDQRRVAPGRCHQFVADDQQAKIVARHIALHQDVVAVRFGGGIGSADLFARGDVDGDALALVAVPGLDHDRQADFVGRGPGIVGAGDDASVRHRHAGGRQQRLGQLLVLGDGFGNGAGGVGFCCLDAALPAAPAEHHHAAFGHAPEGDIAGNGGIDDGAGARSQPHVLVEFAQLRQRRAEVERTVFIGGAAQFLRQLQRQSADRFLGIFAPPPGTRRLRPSAWCG